MTSANPRRNAPGDDEINLEFVVTPGRDKLPQEDAKPAANQHPTSEKVPEASPLVPAKGATPGGPPDDPEKKPEHAIGGTVGKKGKHKLDLVHKKIVKIAWWEWLAYIVHLVILYGWLILMMYLLLKATKDDYQSTQIIYFALFLFSLVFLTVVIWYGQKARKMREAYTKALMSGAAPIEEVAS